jgi:hypothetical protein
MSEIDLLIEELEDVENNPIKPFVAIRIVWYLCKYKYHEYRIAELEAEKCVLEDQQREVKNILIDKNLHIDSLYEEGYKLQQRIAELEAAQRWIPVSERLPDGGHREFYEVACIYQDFGELALFSKGRWVIYEGENIYDVTDRVMFWRKRQYLPDEVIAILSKGKAKPEVQE